MFNLKNSKKGQVQSIAYFLIGIFIIAITVILCRKIVNEFYDGMDEAGINTPIMQQVQNDMKSQAKNMDYGLVIFVVMMIIALLITSFLVPTHPIFIIVNIIGIFVLVFLGMIFHNVYGEMVSGEGSELGDEADQYPLINAIIVYLPYIGAIIILITSIVMYVRGGQNG